MTYFLMYLIGNLAAFLLLKYINNCFRDMFPNYKLYTKSGPISLKVFVIGTLLSWIMFILLLIMFICIAIYVYIPSKDNK